MVGLATGVEGCTRGGVMGEELWEQSEEELVCKQQQLTTVKLDRKTFYLKDTG